MARIERALGRKENACECIAAEASGGRGRVGRDSQRHDILRVFLGVSLFQTCLEICSEWTVKGRGCWLCQGRLQRTGNEDIDKSL